MPNAFLSYSRSDEIFAVDLTKELQLRQWDVWRDQDSLRVGDKWPKLLGEAIASRVFFVLLWSAKAANSDFVELEWTIAMSMKRRMGILMLDSAPLPPTLSPYEARRPASAKKAAKWLDGAKSFGLPSEFYEKPAEKTLKELEKIEGISESEPKGVSARLRIDFGFIHAACNVGCLGAGSSSSKIRFLS
jgi:TIR domain